MSAALSLSSGIIMRLLTASPEELDDIYTSKPILQFLSVKPANGDTEQTPMYRILLSDGEGYIQSKLASALNYLVEEHKIGKYTVARIEAWTLNSIQGMRLIIIQEVKILGNTTEKLGNPSSIDNLLKEQAANEVPPSSSAVRPSSTAPSRYPGPTSIPSRSPAMHTTVWTISSPSIERQISDPPQTASPARAITLIKDLNTYRNKRTIKVEVTHKTAVRNWSNQTSQGKRFNCTFKDESGTISGVAFNDAVDEFYEKFQQGHVYYIAKTRVKAGNPKFTKDAFEISLLKDTEVEECFDERNLGAVSHSFQPLNQLEVLDQDATYDFVAIVTNVSSLSEVKSRNTGHPLLKCDLTLIDQSQTPVRLTLWNQEAREYNTPGNPVVTLRGVKVKDYNGRYLSMIPTSEIKINPDIPEAQALRAWYDASSTIENISSPMKGAVSIIPGGSQMYTTELQALADVKDAHLGDSVQGDMFSIKASIVDIKDSKVAYPACREEGCNKKKVEEVPEGWKCKTCDTVSARPDFRYIMQLTVADHTDQASFQGFNDVGIQLFGMTADELMEMKEHDESEYHAVLYKATTKTYNFTCRAKYETFNDRIRLRYAITKISPLDYLAEARSLLDWLMCNKAPDL